MMHKARIVVPCFNEEARLPAVEFRRFVQEHPDIAFLFVNDGSTDRTERLLRGLCHTAPASLHFISIERNRGKAEAVRHGMVQALEPPTVQYVGFWDADLSTPLNAISTFVQIHDDRPDLILVMGARVQLLGRQVTRQAGRHYSGRVFATAASLVLSLPVYDTQCGAKLFRVTALTREVFAQPFYTGWVFDVEILARMTRFQRLATGLGIENVVMEVPLLEWHDAVGSKRRARDYLFALRDLLLVRHHYLRDLPPARSAAAVPERRPVSRRDQRAVMMR